MSNVRAKIRLLSEKIKKAEQRMGMRQPLVIDIPEDSSDAEYQDIRDQHSVYDGTVYYILETHLGGSV